MHEDRPTKLKVSIGGFMGPSFSIQLQENGMVVYEAYGGGHILEDRVEIRPTGSEWAGFLEEINRLGVWKWRREYSLQVCDGTQWKLEVEHAGRNIEVFGSNCYPSADGSPNCSPTPTECFEQFCVAVSKLAGGRPFR
jgi:hypothetical protein